MQERKHKHKKKKSPHLETSSDYIAALALVGMVMLPFCHEYCNAYLWEQLHLHDFGRAAWLSKRIEMLPTACNHMLVGISDSENGRSCPWNACMHLISCFQIISWMNQGSAHYTWGCYAMTAPPQHVFFPQKMPRWVSNGFWEINQRFSKHVPPCDDSEVG